MAERRLALLVAGALFMENLDGTVIAPAAPAIAESLDVMPGAVSLAISAYLLAVAVGLPFSGWLVDRVGARGCLCPAIVVFTVASVAAAASPDLTTLVALRVVQGAAGALMVPVGRLVVLRSTERGDLVRTVALLTWPALVAPIVAPVVGGALATYAGWRWIFLLNAPLGVVGFVAAVLLVPAGTSHRLRRPFDTRGAVLLTTAVCLLFADLAVLQRSNRLVTTVLVTLTTATAGAAAIRHLVRTRGALLDVRAFAIPSFRVANSSGAVFRLAINAVPFLVPLYFQEVYGWSAFHTGLLVLGMYAGNLAIKPATSALLRRYGFRTVLFGSAVGAVTTVAACAALTAATPVVVNAAVLVLSGVARSVGFTAYNTVGYADVDKTELSAANALSSTIQQLAVGTSASVTAVVLAVVGRIDNEDVGWNYRTAFLVLAALLLLPAAGALRANRALGADLLETKTK